MDSWQRIGITRMGGGRRAAGNDDVLIVEGEAKALYLISIGIGKIMPVVSLTAGVSGRLRGKGRK